LSGYLGEEGFGYVWVPDSFFDLIIRHLNASWVLIL